MPIGVLAVQGAVREHLEALQRLGVEPRPVRTPEEIAACEALILPGGESTTIGKLMDRFGLLEPVRELAASGKPLMGTCAGMILMAKKIEVARSPAATAPGRAGMAVPRSAKADRHGGPKGLATQGLATGIEGQPSLALMDITVERNAFGRQIESFEADLDFEGINSGPVRAVFIRAPIIKSTLVPSEVEGGERVQVLAAHEGRIVAAQEGRLLALSFHPELTADTRVHEYFLSLR